MPTKILMPALSPTMEHGNLAKWLKKEGDTIKAGEVIAEIETDKATMEVEAVDEGILAKILIPQGAQEVPVNTLIAILIFQEFFHVLEMSLLRQEFGTGGFRLLMRSQRELWNFVQVQEVLILQNSETLWH